ncbi:hypothetical protein BH24ACT21_BH24ACT21_09340 [soil metagenome]
MIPTKDAIHESSVGRADLDIDGPTLSIEREKSGVASEDREWLWEATEDPALSLTSVELQGVRCEGFRGGIAG